MEQWPVKPQAMNEHQWYRRIERQIKVVVISANENEGPCPRCGQWSTLFQCQSYPDRQIRCLCKGCALVRAGSSAKVWVRTDFNLRQKWDRNGKDPVKGERMRRQRAEGRLRKPDGGRAAGGASDE